MCACTYMYTCIHVKRVDFRSVLKKEQMPSGKVQGWANTN